MPAVTMRGSLVSWHYVVYSFIALSRMICAFIAICSPTGQATVATATTLSLPVQWRCHLPNEPHTLELGYILGAAARQ